MKLPSLKPPSTVRLLPAMMITAGMVMGLKAVALAESATETQASSTPAPAAATPASAPAPANQPAAASQSCPAPSFADQAGLSATEVDVLQSLGARRTSLDQRQAEMSTDAELLAASEKRVNERLAELQRVQGVVEGLLGKLNDEQEARVAGMVTVYSKMKPKDAAKVFEGLDDDYIAADRQPHEADQSLRDHGRNGAGERGEADQEHPREPENTGRRGQGGRLRRRQGGLTFCGKRWFLTPD
ncbi:MAG: hypothetical protein WDN76_06020 [Alphaproteobacteria bacterium]